VSYESAMKAAKDAMKQADELAKTDPVAAAKFASQVMAVAIQVDLNHLLFEALRSAKPVPPPPPPRPWWRFWGDA
jgi:hypothetical protein